MAKHTYEQAIRKVAQWGIPKARQIANKVAYPLIPKINKSRILRDALGLKNYEALTRLDASGYTALREDGNNVSRFKPHKQKGDNPFRYMSATLAVMVAYGFAPEELDLLGAIAIGTVTSFNPDEDPESTSCAGFARDLGGASDTWDTLHDGLGSKSAFADEDPIARYQATATTNQYAGITRGIHLYDSSSLPDGDTITAAKVQLYGLTVTDDFTDSADICSSAPASNTTLAANDYDTLGTTSFSNVSMSSLSTSAFNDFDLNGSGVSAISKTGITKFGLRLNADLTDSEPTWSSSADENFTTSGPSRTSQEPILEVTHVSTSPIMQAGRYWGPV